MVGESGASQHRRNLVCGLGFVPLLVKLLFTSDKLSVQVHPEDDYAGKHHDGSRGKTEMWHILRAEPDAKIALGVREEVTAEELRDAALSGAIMDLLDWIPVRPGDTFLYSRGYDSRYRRRDRVVRGATAFGYHVPAFRLRARSRTSSGARDGGVASGAAHGDGEAGIAGRVRLLQD